MYYVYLLRSKIYADQSYIGFSADLKSRVRDHNEGKLPHTSKYKPWRLVTYLAFDDKKRALSFEEYLKSHSGKAFAAKHLW